MVMQDATKAMLEPYFSQTVSLEGKLRAGVFCDSRSSDWECAAIIILTEGFFENDEEVKVSAKEVWRLHNLRVHISLCLWGGSVGCVHLSCCDTESFVTLCLSPRCGNFLFAACFPAFIVEISLYWISLCFIMPCW